MKLSDDQVSILPNEGLIHSTNFISRLSKYGFRVRPLARRFFQISANFRKVFYVRARFDLEELRRVLGVFLEI